MLPLHLALQGVMRWGADGQLLEPRVVYQGATNHAQVLGWAGQGCGMAGQGCGSAAQGCGSAGRACVGGCKRRPMHATPLHLNADTEMPQVPHVLQVPDGMTIDAAGNLWVALAESGSVVCFDPEGGWASGRGVDECSAVAGIARCSALRARLGVPPGSIQWRRPPWHALAPTFLSHSWCGEGRAGKELERVALPVRRPTACTFGGEGLRRLFVTTRAESGAGRGGAWGGVGVVDVPPFARRHRPAAPERLDAVRMHRQGRCTLHARTCTHTHCRAGRTATQRRPVPPGAAERAGGGAGGGAGLRLPAAAAAALTSMASQNLWSIL